MKTIVNMLNEFWENLEYYLIDNPKSYYKMVRHWYYCKGSNPWFWKSLWYNMWHNYPWDMYYSDKQLYYQLQQSLYYFKHKCIWIGDIHKNRIIKYQELCLRLLNILINDDDLFNMQHDEDTEEIKYICKVYVNTQNASRFPVLCMNYEQPEKFTYSHECFDMYPHELYKQKAKSLLYKILYTYGDEWWD